MIQHRLERSTRSLQEIERPQEVRGKWNHSVNGINDNPYLNGCTSLLRQSAAILSRVQYLYGVNSLLPAISLLIASSANEQLYSRRSFLPCRQHEQSSTTADYALALSSRNDQSFLQFDIVDRPGPSTIWAEPSNSCLARPTDNHSTALNAQLLPSRAQWQAKD